MIVALAQNTEEEDTKQENQNSETLGPGTDYIRSTFYVANPVFKSSHNVAYQFLQFTEISRACMMFLCDCVFIRYL